MSKQDNETFLARWLNNELTDSELEDFKNTSEFKEYEKIRRGLTYFRAPSFEKEQQLQHTFDKLTKKHSKKTIRLKPLLYTISAAASILLIIGLFFNTITHSTAHGEKRTVALPDGSSVELNAASSIRYKRFFWQNNREIQLTGEAYFVVTKGEKFSVHTTSGEVKVLGTRFNLKDRANQYKVSCYEGKVQVTTAEDYSVKLEKGETISVINKKISEEKTLHTEPLWKKGESLFDSVPLGEVLDEIERQYNISFVRGAIPQEKIFTGGFIHTDLEIALETVLTPMGITYSKENTTVTLFVK
ncbi:hypothetical protein HN014_07635 [Aquimarina sp. TRL1]|uniref:FecR family protein n=1 Tax=Aquimarina sp. (strain TRL1) TaxID=2736252 RepID=UPI00158E5438|nr:FecR domain-containing protein [Aquimarina sp. TRL1]QKX04790.1 hypothetical protein HN014_07635 [Aquimarina sp. TRL1]